MRCTSSVVRTLIAIFTSVMKHITAMPSNRCHRIAMTHDVSDDASMQCNSITFASCPESGGAPR